jgi:hypothetical protein
LRRRRMERILMDEFVSTIEQKCEGGQEISGREYILSNQRTLIEYIEWLEFQILKPGLRMDMFLKWDKYCREENTPEGEGCEECDLRLAKFCSDEVRCNLKNFEIKKIKRQEDD